MDPVLHTNFNSNQNQSCFWSPEEVFMLQVDTTNILSSLG